MRGRLAEVPERTRREAQRVRGIGHSFIFFHGARHPAEMAEPQINAFLTKRDGCHTFGIMLNNITRGHKTAQTP